MALVGTALAATLTVVAVLLLYGFLGGGGGLPQDAADQAVVVGVALAVVSSIAAIPFVLFALRDREDAVDEVFLVHRSGLLMVHLSKSLKAAKDQDLLAGMLTAVQSFIQEAFATGPSRELRQMDFGNRKILLRKGFHSYLAVIVRGRRPTAFTHRTRRALGKVEGMYWRVIASWDGTNQGLEGADDLLRTELMDSRLRTVARDVVDAAVDGIASGLVGLWQRRRARGQARRDGENRGPRARAAELLDRPEARDLQASYHELLVTALEQIRDGRFTMAGATNVYLALALQRTPQSSAVAWWEEVLLTVQDVLRAWSWDSEAQAWVESRAPAIVTESAEAPSNEVPAAPVTLQTHPVPRGTSSRAAR